MGWRDDSETSDYSEPLSPEEERGREAERQRRKRQKGNVWLLILAAVLVVQYGVLLVLWAAER